MAASVAKMPLPYRFAPRDYQIPVLRAFDRGCRRGVLVWHRRAGKDKTCLNITISRSAERKGAYYYYFPTATWGRKALWEGRDNDGMAFLDHFPPGSVVRKNDTEMVVETRWGAIFRVIGTDRLEIVGPNPVGCVFSEYSLHDPRAWTLVQPILRGNDGWALFDYTPRGRNHGWRLYQIARHNPDEWFCQLLTIRDTGVIAEADVARDVKRGLISAQMAQQEYYCSFTQSQDGAYYGEAMAWLRTEGRVRAVAHNPALPVYTVWDPGYTTAVWYFQPVGLEIAFLRAEQEHGWGMERWSEHLDELAREHGYRYGGHYAPFDTEANNAYRAVAGKSLLETARENGLDFTVLPVEHRVIDGIERTRKFLYQCWFDADGCQEGIDALDGYVEARKNDSDPDNPVFTGRPAENFAKHLADACRYGSLAAPQVRMLVAPPDGPPEYEDSRGIIRSPMRF